MNILVCGGGNGSHVLAGLVANNPDFSVRVLTLFGDESVRWQRSMNAVGDCMFHIISQSKKDGQNEIFVKPFPVTNDPNLLFRDFDPRVIFFVVPSFVHGQYFTALKDFLKPGVTIVGLPGGSGFEFDAKVGLGDKLDDINLLSCESLPWACRIKEYGRSVEIFGYKCFMYASSRTARSTEGSSAPEVLDFMSSFQKILGPLPEVRLKSHLLAITLNNPNARIHPAIMYAKWKDYDGQVLQTEPLFYHGVDKDTVSVVVELDKELLGLVEAIKKNHSKINLDIVRTFCKTFVDFYGHEIGDKDNIYDAVYASSAHASMTHPMLKTSEGMVPDFKSRYLSEDIPFGLCVIKGIADLVNFETPMIDKIILWAQEKLGKQYLIDGKLIGSDLKETRSPQRFGFFTLNDTLLC